MRELPRVVLSFYVAMTCFLKPRMSQSLPKTAEKSGVIRNFKFATREQRAREESRSARLAVHSLSLSLGVSSFPHFSYASSMGVELVPRLVDAVLQHLQVHTAAGLARRARAEAPP